MSRRYLYLVASLPALGEIGAARPPLTSRELLERLDPLPRVLAETVFLADDLRWRESYMAGARSAREPVVLTARQARDEAPLPAGLAPSAYPSAAPSVAADRVWEAYFAYASAVAERQRSEALAAWVRFEVGLRNALAIARAGLLGLDPARFLVVPELGLPAAQFVADVRAWSQARDPLEAERALDAARWAWIGRHDAWFRFTSDELVAYAVRLSLVDRWHRFAHERSAA